MSMSNILTVCSQGGRSKFLETCLQKNILVKQFRSSTPLEVVWVCSLAGEEGEQYPGALRWITKS